MIVELDHVRKEYGTTQVFHDLSATIPPGTLLAILGVNGAGKTTLLRMLAGVTGVNAGHILLDNSHLDRDNLQQRQKSCFIPDFPTLFADRTPLENISIYLNLWKTPQTKESHSRILTWLEEFDLLEHANTPIALLSRGQIFKSALLAMMAVDPELWLIDEPFASGMDPQGIAMFKKYAREAVERGKSVIYTTQLLDLAETYSDQIWVIHHGELVANGTSTELKDGHSSLETLFAKLREQ